ncbi:uncharacterized protein TNIN_64441 [Trichonephila inaurata madagascariensis]|uniref:Uncharacterized protein n=1 Tax=Trichonephila inaurata madagascariensis TaxID=2747483 RepID=A0A8X7CH45_9ARAC|nr:uncharacterized protein TNIN_64441 [Trichonephila inaurata madagascariensis]
MNTLKVVRGFEHHVPGKCQDEPFGKLSAPPAPLPVQPIPAEEEAGGSDREPPRRQTMTTASWELAPSSNSLTLKQTRYESPFSCY